MNDYNYGDGFEWGYGYASGLEDGNGDGYRYGDRLGDSDAHRLEDFTFEDRAVADMDD